MPGIRMPVTRVGVFFAGWSARSARPLLPFLAGVVLALLVGFAALALALGRATDDPGQGVEIPQRMLSGILVDGPYPYLAMAPDTAHPQGHTILLTAQGKIAIDADVRAFAGKHVAIPGLYMKRGGIDMLEVTDLPKLTQPVAVFSAPVAVALGTWRITGELCDGKCWIGWMRPGGGLAHKACANVCLIGGVPPVLVSATEVAGSQFLLPLGPDGKMLADGFRDLVGIRVVYEGEVFRVGDLLVFHTDVARARTP